MLEQTENLRRIGPIDQNIMEDSKRMAKAFAAGTQLGQIPQSEFLKALDADDELMYVGLFNVPHRLKFGYNAHGEIYLDFMRNPRILRLTRLSELGVIHSEPVFISATHTRLEHALVMAVMAELVLAKNGKSDAANLGIASSFLHDIATAPFSDQGKLACPGALDEEGNAETVLRDESISALLEKYGVPKQDVIACIKGVHPRIGRLVNSSHSLDLDRIAHTAYDAVRTYGRHPFGDIVKHVTHPYLFDIFDDIELADDGAQVFSDPSKVKAFLWTRALMYRDVYRNPLNAAKEAFLKRELQRLWAAGILTAEGMLSMDDMEFQAIIQKNTEPTIYQALFSPLTLRCSEVARIYGKNAEEVRSRCEDETHIVEERRPFDPATRTLVNYGDRVLEFRDAMPEEAGGIEEVSRQCGYTGVYELAEGRTPSAFQHPGQTIFDAFDE